jgi:hypothetical protein
VEGTVAWKLPYDYFYVSYSQPSVIMRTKHPAMRENAFVLNNENKQMRVKEASSNIYPNKKHNKCLQHKAEAAIHVTGYGKGKPSSV